MDFSVNTNDMQYKKIQDKINNIQNNLFQVYQSNYKGGLHLDSTGIQYKKYFEESDNQQLLQINMLKNILKYLEELKSKTRVSGIHKEDINLDINNIKEKIFELENHFQERKK